MDAQPLQESNPPAGVDRNAPAAAGDDWRAQLHPEARSRIANRILKALLKCLPVETSQAVDELLKISVRFEEKIYTAATSQPDYMRKISLKMLGMEMKTQPARGNAQVNPNQYNTNQG
ncbi:mediator of RNA polymerase II transcription subunit 15a-like [Lolium rigidum]|uniref:mediator of RNA polymerase II transcription subunit 15a-like n=1 Tax=Lolium rigidum TaxID=89674 RepID=UPI001F5C4728|nr:mediator of RNA polymerase II transcription subunit 15a-like [Lolium rigidum]